MDDRDAVVATVTDYFEGWFDGDAERMERALHPALAKTGVGFDKLGAAFMESMNATDMIGWTGEGQGVARKPDGFTFEVTVNDLYRHIATVTVHSTVYREYLHLAKTPDGWKILNALYMSMT
ncbi:nuclear transport factor 2 family protein [Catelliglobosispora koreensis]|uniref:nuclear transport factor 2 family protein n=1 Tax=Catelliglobosispora koreensis TaxID=129052 RepID=UPI0003764A75|nr:nuclear transport factor 2 family protein [Catelliglobosispora koreensis]